MESVRLSLLFSAVFSVDFVHGIIVIVPIFAIFGRGRGVLFLEYFGEMPQAGKADVGGDVHDG